MDGTWKHFWQSVHNVKWRLVLRHSAVGDIFSWYVPWALPYMQSLSWLSSCCMNVLLWQQTTGVSYHYYFSWVSTGNRAPLCKVLSRHEVKRQSLSQRPDNIGLWQGGQVEGWCCCSLLTLRWVASELKATPVSFYFHFLDHRRVTDCMWALGNFPRLKETQTKQAQGSRATGAGCLHWPHYAAAAMRWDSVAAVSKAQLHQAFQLEYSVCVYLDWKKGGSLADPTN